MQSINRAARRRSSRELAKRPQWVALEEFARSRIQGWIQDLLEEEVVELLGRRKSARQSTNCAPKRTTTAATSTATTKPCTTYCATACR